MGHVWAYVAAGGLGVLATLLTVLLRALRLVRSQRGYFLGFFFGSWPRPEAPAHDGPEADNEPQDEASTHFIP